MAFLEINGVHKSYGATPVLRGLDLHVEKHEVACLIGASGCGKSTLLRCVNALEDINDGTILLDGDVVSGEGVDVDRLRRRVGIVFQAFNLFPHMSALDNITLAPMRVLGRTRDVAEQQALELLERVGLREKAGAVPDSLSGGQQQRVAILRAMAMDPDVLLLDEVTSALDPVLVGDVLTIIRELATSGLTILMATHEMSFAKEVAHRVAYIHEGVVLEQGPPARIFEDPQEEHTRRFLDKIVAAGRL